MGNGAVAHNHAAAAETVEHFSERVRVHVGQVNLLAELCDELAERTRDVIAQGEASVEQSHDEKPNVVESLVDKGFTLRQALRFYSAKRLEGLIGKGTTTDDVVKTIIIPETSTESCCYMESRFMSEQGGGHRAKKLVSHAWKSEFVITLTNIVLDATQWSTSCFTEACKENDYTPFFRDGLLDSERLLQTLTKDQLDSTYWLCIFAVNEHLAICGDCWSCHHLETWKSDVQRHLKANPCLICRERKWNPCVCGSSKLTDRDVGYEIDKFSEVVARMDALVVSLDGGLETIKRIWVVAEIAEASKQIPVFFRLVAGLSGECIEKLASGTSILDTVRNCDATSQVDKDRILSEVEQTDGGVEAYDSFVNALLELNFGVCKRITSDAFPVVAKRALTRLSNIEMKLSWNRKLLTLDEPLNAHVVSNVLLSLHNLTIDAHGCRTLGDVSALGCLQALTTLSSLTLNFVGTQVSDISALACLEKLATLSSLTLDFSDTQVSDISALASLEKLATLSSLTLNFSETQVSEISVLACLEKLTTLSSMTLNFDKTQVSDISVLACLEKLATLSSLTLNFSETQVSDISALACLEKLNCCMEFWLFWRSSEQFLCSEFG